MCVKLLCDTVDCSKHYTNGSVLNGMKFPQCEIQIGQNTKQQFHSDLEEENRELRAYIKDGRLPYTLICLEYTLKVRSHQKELAQPTVLKC